MQTTLIILKPDCVQRGLMGDIVSRFERKGLRIVGGKFMQVPEDVARRHYAEHEGKPFFPSLLSFITSSPVLVLAIRGNNAVEICRTLIGPTNGAQAAPGTIRGDFGMNNSTNLVHGSDSPESAERELALWFDATELHDWERDGQAWIDK
jgi:nucleoside-diphosphate kinase